MDNKNFENPSRHGIHKVPPSEQELKSRKRFLERITGLDWVKQIRHDLKTIPRKQREILDLKNQKNFSKFEYAQYLEYVRGEKIAGVPLQGDFFEDIRQEELALEDKISYVIYSFSSNAEKLLLEIEKFYDNYGHSRKSHYFSKLENLITDYQSEFGLRRDDDAKVGSLLLKIQKFMDMLDRKITNPSDESA